LLFDEAKSFIRQKERAVWFFVAKLRKPPALCLAAFATVKLFTPRNHNARFAERQESKEKFTLW
jgi:hypothetical protein